MNSGHRLSGTVEAGVSPVSQSNWQRRLSESSRSGAPPLRNENIEIRDAKLTDSPSLAKLMCELGYETSGSEMRQRLKLILSDPRCGTFVAKIGNELCGMIGTLTHMSHEHNDLSGTIIALVVSRKLRRSGIGRALIGAAEKDFANRNVKRITLTTRFAREEAHRFYEMVGYSKTGFRFAKDFGPSHCQ
jgi:ribosomal protein S18 acetylase RimI-like enzyme